MKLKRPRILLAGFAAALALIGGVEWLNWRQTVRVRETAALVARTHAVQAGLNRLLSLLGEIESDTRGFVVTGDPEFVEMFESKVKAVTEQQRSLEQMMLDAELRARLSTLEPLIAERIAIARHNVEVRRSTGFEAARQRVASGTGKAVMDELRSEFAQMDARAQTLLYQRAAAARRESDTSQRLRIFGMSVSFALLIAVFALMLRENRLRQRAEEQMAGNIKTLAEFKAALDEHAIVAITDARGKITYVNDMFCAISKYAREELLGQDHRIINSGHHPKEFIRELWQTITSGRVWKGELKNRAKDDSFYWVDTTIVPFLDDHGKPTQFIAIRTDITEIKQAEENIVQLNAELRQRTVEIEVANKELESFSYSVSHDLRAPLRHINGFSQALLEDCADQLDDVGKGHLKLVCEASREMAQLIDDLLQLARVTRIEMRGEKIDLSELAAGILAGMQKLQPERIVNVTVEKGLVAYGDKRLLGITLTNLLENAWKFTSKRKSAEIVFGFEQANGNTGYFVRDNGAGFDMAYVDKLYGAFQRLHATAEFEGTGIGLATVQRIIHRHGGRVWAKGAVNKGATFYFTLPEFKELKKEFENEG